MTDLYQLLEVESTASTKEIKAAFRKKSRSTHPDVGGSSEEFNEILAAYNILKDSFKRAAYDSGVPIESLGDFKFPSEDHGTVPEDIPPEDSSLASIFEEFKGDVVTLLSSAPSSPTPTKFAPPKTPKV